MLSFIQLLGAQYCNKQSGAMKLFRTKMIVTQLWICFFFGGKKQLKMCCSWITTCFRYNNNTLSISVSARKMSSQLLFSRKIRPRSGNPTHFSLTWSFKPFSVTSVEQRVWVFLGSPQANTGLIQTRAAPGIPSKSTVTSPPGAKAASTQIRSPME